MINAAAQQCEHFIICNEINIEFKTLTRICNLKIGAYIIVNFCSVTKKFQSYELWLVLVFQLYEKPLNHSIILNYLFQLLNFYKPW